MKRDEAGISQHILGSLCGIWRWAHNPKAGGSKAMGKNLMEKPYKIGHFQWGNRFGIPQF